MAITVDFILRASASQFTRATAQINNSLESVKHSLKRFDVGNGLKGLIGVGGVIEGFRAAIGYAQELRTEAEKLGKPLDNNVRSVAQLGDNFEAIYKGFKRGLVDGLSFFTKTGEAAGSLINRLKGISAEQEKLAEQTAKDADAAEKRLQESREANTPAKVKEARDKSTDKTGMAQDEGHRYAFLLNKEDELRESMGKTGKNTVKYYELQDQLTDTISERKKIDTERDDKRDRKAREELKLAEESDKTVVKDKADLIKKFAPSVEELAAQDIGTGVGGNDPRIKARLALQNEDRAKMLFSQGDYKGGLKLAQAAQDTRKSLESGGMTGEGSPLTKETATTAFADALEKTNTELEGIKTAMAGLIKARK